MSNIQCSICLDSDEAVNPITNQEQGRSLYATKCGHVFHHACITSWIKISKSCPICVTPLTLRGIKKLYLVLENEPSAVKQKGNVAGKKSAAEIRELEKTNEDLQKENNKLKLKLGETASELMYLKKRSEKEKDDVVKKLKKINGKRPSQRNSQNTNFAMPFGFDYHPNVGFFSHFPAPAPTMPTMHQMKLDFEEEFNEFHTRCFNALTQTSAQINFKMNL